MAGIFTISREDYYDYLRCPKIVAIKTHRYFMKPPPPPKPEFSRNVPYEIGTIGEIATKEILSEPEAFDETEEIDEDEDYSITEPEFTPRSLEINLKAKGVHLDMKMQGIVKETLEGLKSIKKYLTDEYGSINILGRAESRSGTMPGKIKPDFVAISENRKKPLLIEIKNTAKISTKPDNFQASYYNSLSQTQGILVVEERQEEGKNELMPKILENVLPETLLVYPRLGEFQIIRDSIKIDQKNISEIWQAKQLGLQGKTPHTNCDSKCPHHRYEKLPEDNVEPAVPLSLVLAKGIVEQKHDLDLDYMIKHFSKLGLRLELRKNLWDFHAINNPFLHIQGKEREKFAKKEKKLNEKKERYLEMFSEKTGIDRKTMELMIKSKTRLDEKKILKEMKDEIHPWKKMLGRKRFDKFLPYAKGQSTIVYSIPEKSNEFVKKAWKQWD